MDLSALPCVKCTLVASPLVHEQVAPGGPRVTAFTMDVRKKSFQVSDDAWLKAMTVNGSVPGPIMVVHEGDYVELTLRNPPANMLQHNILHASTGALGGGAGLKFGPASQTIASQRRRPGEQVAGVRL